MTTTAANRAKLLGGLLGLLLGVVCLDFLPPLGLAETVCAIVVIVTRRRGACWVMQVPTILIVVSAVTIMVTVSGWSNPLMWPIAVSSVAISASLLLGATDAPSQGTVRGRRS